jgi:hypothetical protein
MLVSDMTGVGNVQIGLRTALTTSSFGYSPSWKVLILGSIGTNYLTDATTISLGYDPSGNPNGAFSGNGSEILTRNPVWFVQPNSANNAYFFPFKLENGEVYNAHGMLTSSDKRLKKNLLTVSDALNKVLSLEGVSYEWDENSVFNIKQVGSDVHKKAVPNGRYYGVVAQELEKVLPELVREDLDGIKAVSYEGLIPVLIEAIKEQQKMIDSLKAEVSQIQVKLQ